MTPKALFIDIDGTLALPGLTTAPQSALDAIRAARAKGHKAFLCTGRNRSMLAPFLQLGCFDGFVGSAGGMVVCGQEVLYDHPMTDDQRDLVMELLGREHVLRTLECADAAYSDDMNALFAQVDPASMNSEMLRWYRQCSESLGMLPLREYARQPVYKIVFMCSRPEQLDAARKAAESDFNFVFQDFSPENGIGSSFINGELINRAFDKGRGVKTVCRHLGLDLADSIGFGDSMNDWEMMETVGTSVCMANGAPRLQALSDIVAPRVDEDGLAKVFHQLGLC